MKILLSAVVFTYNEEKNLPSCLESLKRLECELLVVDSGSTDRTIEIAKHYGAKIVQHPWESPPKQWNWALRNLPFSYEWALWLDADHRLTPELAEEIVQLFHDGELKEQRDRLWRQSNANLSQVDGFYVKRRQIFRGRWIRHGGYYPKYLLKLVRHKQAWCDENELLDVRLYVKGRTAVLQHDLNEDNQNELDILFWISKHTHFAQLQAAEEFLRRQGGVAWSIRPSLFGAPDQRTLWLKDRWYRMPLYLRPFVYFFYRYFLRLGLLDGKQGFIFHFLQAFWYRLVVDMVLEGLLRGPEPKIKGDRSSYGRGNIAPSAT